MVYFLVGLGGIIGALLRYLVGLTVTTSWPTSFPLATLLINFIGCFLLGWLTTYLFQLKVLPSSISTAIGTGIIGSFTTFSTFSVDSVQLITSGKWTIAFSYIFLSLVGGLVLTFIGYKLGSFQFNKSKKASSLVPIEERSEK